MCNKRRLQERVCTQVHTDTVECSSSRSKTLAVPKPWRLVTDISHVLPGFESSFAHSNSSNHPSLLVSSRNLPERINSPYTFKLPALNQHLDAPINLRNCRKEPSHKGIGTLEHSQLKRERDSLDNLVDMSQRFVLQLFNSILGATNQLVQKRVSHRGSGCW